MKSRSIVLAFLMQLATATLAQPGRTGLGIRSSLDGAGFTAIQLINRSYAIEGQLNVGGQRALRGQSLYVCMLLQYHLDLPVPYVRIYFGGGAQGGYWVHRQEAEHEQEVMAGLSGVGGVEFWLRRVPLALSGDFRPAINYLQEVEFFPHNIVGISLRYYFGSNRVEPFVYPRRVRRNFK
jgi:hypothetical protein